MTYAFSLYGLGRSADGIEIMKKLPVEGLHDPHAAVYAAVLLLDENQIAAAQEYVSAALAGPIFPEEKSCSRGDCESQRHHPRPTPAPSATSTP